ncbi:MAG: hypothetical protein MZV70_61010 [Desulfobacterales bacterium]|nr:hypothetical protein [Desulfobacterales bacterium]
MYDEIWTAGKVMYKLEQVVAAQGPLIIYAPHIREVSRTLGALHRGGRLPHPRLPAGPHGPAQGCTARACWPT